MTRRIAFVALAALALAVTLTLPVSAQTGTRAEIEKITQAWQKAFNAGDAAAVAALYAKDGKLMPPGDPDYRGGHRLRQHCARDREVGGQLGRRQTPRPRAVRHVLQEGRRKLEDLS